MLRLTLIKRKKIPQELTIPISMKIGDLHCIHTKLCFDFFFALDTHITYRITILLFSSFKISNRTQKVLSRNGLSKAFLAVNFNTFWFKKTQDSLACFSFVLKPKSLNIKCE